MKKILLALTGYLVASSAYAGGFRVSIQGQRALAMGHTGVAVVNSAELAFFNPAGLVYLENKLNVSAGVTGIISNTKYQNLNTREAFETDNPIGSPINLYATYKISEKVSAGIAVYTPYGSRVDWPTDWAGGFLVNSIELSAIFINPVVSFKVNDALSIGGGPIYAIGGVNFNRNIELQPNNSTASTSGPTSIEVNSEGVTSWGWKASILFRPSEKLNIGASYQSQIDISAENGDVSFQNFPGTAPSTNFNATLPLPAEITLGLSYQVNKKLLLAFDFNRAYWGAYKSLDLFFTNTDLAPSINPRNYNDADTYRIGAQYDLNHRFTFRAGYYFDESPVASGFFSPETPRNDSNAVTGGLSFNINQNLAIDASFLFIHFDEIDESFDSPNDGFPRFEGTYKSNVFAPGIGITYKL